MKTITRIVCLLAVVGLAVLAVLVILHPQVSREDILLRKLTGAHVFHSTYTFPKEESHAVLLTLEFEDGQLKRRSALTLSPISEHSGAVGFQFLWNKEGRTVWGLTSTYQIIGQYSTYDSGENPFWAKMETGRLDPQTPFAYEGYTILGFSTSLLSNDPDHALLNGSDFFEELKNKKYVAAVAIKTFKTEAEGKTFNEQVMEEARERKKQEKATAENQP